MCPEYGTGKSDDQGDQYPQRGIAYIPDPLLAEGCRTLCSTS